MCVMCYTGEDTLLGDPTMSIDDMKFLGDDSITPIKVSVYDSQEDSQTEGTSTVPWAWGGGGAPPPGGQK